MIPRKKSLPRSTTPIKRSAIKKVERRDCRVCDKRIQRVARDAGWSHVRAPKPSHQPVPYASKRTPKRTSLMRQADALWSQIVKVSGRCAASPLRIQLLGFDPMSGRTIDATARIACAGALEAAHVVPRRHRSTRWMPENGRALCSGHHQYFTGSEKAWRDFIGPEWDRLWIKAQELWDRDYVRVLASLRAYPRSGASEATEP